MKDLGILYRCFAKEVVALLHCFNGAHNATCPARVQEMCVIRLHDAWARFCRELIIISSYARPYSANGQRIPRVSGLRSYRQALRAIEECPRRHRRRYEPRWAYARESIQIATCVGISNLSNVSAGIGLTPSPLEELRQVRNFFAHRNARTAQMVRDVAVQEGLPTRPLDLVNYLQSPSGVTRFESWVIQLQLMASIAVQYP